MASFNKVILMGNLTRDPEIRQTQSGSYVAKAGLAVNESMPDGQGGYREEAHFFDVTFFGRQAESFAKWFQKGRPVLVEGRLNYGSWEDKETGQKRSKVDVVGLRWHFVGGGRDENVGSQQGGGGRGQQVAAGSGPEFPERDSFGSGSAPDDVPF
ncbi:MAG: single-stranded DNA-binding protein [Planctomycetes bacterium]|nr:single-stranded DNA-binding protein [Planctomycetota bacterium]